MHVNSLKRMNTVKLPVISFSKGELNFLDYWIIKSLFSGSWQHNVCLPLDDYLWGGYITLSTLWATKSWSIDTNEFLRSLTKMYEAEVGEYPKDFQKSIQFENNIELYRQRSKYMHVHV